MLEPETRNMATHGIALVVCGIFAMVVFAMAALGRPYYAGWADTVAYFAHARHMHPANVLNQKFADKIF